MALKNINIFITLTLLTSKIVFYTWTMTMICNMMMNFINTSAKTMEKMPVKKYSFIQIIEM